jgi:hypothetical protein
MISGVFAGNISDYTGSHFAFMPADRAYEEAVALGVHWERPHPGPMVWGNIEKQKGVYDWNWADFCVQRSQGHDLNLLMTIWPFADWDQGDCHGSECEGAGFEKPGELPMKRCSPCNISAYKEFVRKVVERYDGDGYEDMPGLKAGIKYWEASNEPSMQGGELIFFKGASEDYLEILNTTYQAVKESDPDASVLHAGMAGFSDDPGSDECREFWNPIYSEASRYFDIANIHSIGSGGEHLWISEMYEFMQEHNVSKPLWITEVQYSLWGLGEESLTGDEWAQVIVRSFVFGLGNGAEKLFYVALKGNPGETGPELITEDDEKRQAYYSFGTMVDEIDYFTSVEKLTESQYRFKMNNTYVYVLWGSGSVPGELTGTLDVSDIYGGIEEKEASEIVLSESPIYMTVSGCELAGDEPPCGVVTSSEVIDFINLWAESQATLSDVINLIVIWASGG